MSTNLNQKLVTLTKIFKRSSRENVSLPRFLFFTFKSYLNNFGLLIDNKFFLISHNKTQLLLNSHMSTDINTYFEIFRYDEYLSLVALLKENPNTDYAVIDLGANIGLFYAYLNSKDISLAQYIGVEALTTNLPCLVFNTLSPRTTIIPKAVWKHHKGVELSAHMPSNANTVYEKADGLIPSITLTEVFSQLTEERPIVVKMDIEGAEKEVLESAITLVNTKVSFLCVEFHNVIDLDSHKIATQKLLSSFDLVFEPKENNLVLVIGKNSTL